MGGTGGFPPNFLFSLFPSILQGGAPRASQSLPTFSSTFFSLSKIIINKNNNKIFNNNNKYNKYNNNNNNNNGINIQKEFNLIKMCKVSSKFEN